MHGRLAGRPDVPDPILVYRDHLLRFSEIWVRAQGEALQDFRAYYAGSKRIADVPVPEDREFLINRGARLGRIAEGLFKTVGWAPTLRRYADHVAPVLIHAHYGLDGALVLPLVRSLNLPLVVTFHGFDAMTRDAYAAKSFYVHRKYLRQRARLIGEGTLFIAVSKFIRGLLLEQGFPAERTVVHYIGVDVRLFTPDPRIPREAVVLFAGRLEPEKGCDDLIRAMSEVQSVNPEVELVVIGDGKQRENLEQLARSRLRRYRFLGAQPQDTIRHWLNRARVFCVPSVRLENGEGEAFGLVFAEAQSMGVPVVSYASGGIPEAVAHEETGFLAQEREWRALTKHIVQLLKDQALWDCMSRAGRERTTRLFDLRVQTGLLEDLYRSAIEGRGRLQTPISPVASPK